jgi:hypothetical protein
VGQAGERDHLSARALSHLKQIARRFQITIFMVVHPTKESGRNMTLETASLCDVSGGTAWNDKADLGIVIWADDVWQPERHIKICESRNFVRYGQPGIVRMQFDRARSVYNVIGAGKWETLSLLEELTAPPVVGPPLRRFDFHPATARARAVGGILPLGDEALKPASRTLGQQGVGVGD